MYLVESEGRFEIADADGRVERRDDGGRGKGVWREMCMYMEEEEVVWGIWHAMVVVLGFRALMKYVEHNWLYYVQGIFLPTVSPAGPALGPLYIKIPARCNMGNSTHLMDISSTPPCFLGTSLHSCTAILDGHSGHDIAYTRLLRLLKERHFRGCSGPRFDVDDCAI